MQICKTVLENIFLLHTLQFPTKYPFSSLDWYNHIFLYYSTFQLISSSLLFHCVTEDTCSTSIDNILPFVSWFKSRHLFNFHWYNFYWQHPSFCIRRHLFNRYPLHERILDTAYRKVFSVFGKLTAQLKVCLCILQTWLLYSVNFKLHSVN